MKIMKTKILKLAAILLLAGMVSCNNDEIIPFKEYTVSENCYLTNLIYNGVTIINSDEELEQHTTCYYGATVPKIDFKKYSLICASDNSSYGIKSINKQIIRSSNNKFILEVTVFLTWTTEADGWTMSLLIPKLPQDAEFILDAKYKIPK
jgi:hypothetical protein